MQQPTLVPLPTGIVAKRNWRGLRRPNRKAILIGFAAAAILIAVTVLHIRANNGTLEITLDDPNATVTVDGTDIVVSGITGVKEFRLKAGDYAVHQTKVGQPEKTEVVSIKQGEKTPLRVTFEADAASRLRLSGMESPTTPATSDVNAKRMDLARRMAADLEEARSKAKIAEVQAAAAEDAQARADNTRNKTEPAPGDAMNWRPPKPSQPKSRKRSRPW